MAITRLALAAVLCLTATAFAAPNSRIIGGEDVNSGAQPHVVSVRVDNSHVGVGTIISKDYILTVAHIVSQLGSTPIDTKRVTVRSGSINQFGGGVLNSVSEINIHPSFGNFLHDIAILKLSKSLTFDDKTKSLDYADEDEEIANGTETVVAGWGLQASGASPYKLQQTKLTVLNSQECEEQAGYGYDSVLCLTHDVQQGICRGDEGAGVISNDKVVGVASFSFGSCGTKYPDIAANVAYYSAWIKDVTK